MKFTLFAILILNSAFSYAKDCSYLITSDDLKLEWTAFKTPKKIGVKGQFKKLGITKDLKGKTLKSLLEGTEFNIDATSVHTKNESRDAKIVKSFFKVMKSGAKITGSIKKYAKKTLIVSITMNGVTKDVPLSVELNNDKLEAVGYIDVLDFALNKSLAGINKACLELHEGKTWNDVKLELEARFSKFCD